MSIRVTLLSLALVVFVGAATLASIQSRHLEATELPVYGTVPTFSLTDSTNAPFERTALDGKLWLLNFFFTSCPGPCPETSAEISRLSRALQNHQLQFVSISVDPETDTPDKLADYARRFNANPKQWHFLTGTKNIISDLITQQLKVGFEQDLTVHSNKLILVDAKSQIRGFYTLADQESRLGLIRDIKQLETEF